MDFHTAYNAVIADLTPQPWDYTDSAGTTLTVIPAGLREDPGCAEVYIRITASDTTPVEAAVTTRYLPRMIASLVNNRMWSHDTMDDVCIGLTPFGGGGMLLTLSGDAEAVAGVPQVHVPEAWRLPLASGLWRAWDVARGWED